MHIHTLSSPVASASSSSCSFASLPRKSAPASAHDARSLCLNCSPSAMTSSLNVCIQTLAKALAGRRSSRRMQPEEKRSARTPLYFLSHTISGQTNPGDPQKSVVGGAACSGRG